MRNSYCSKGSEEISFLSLEEGSNHQEVFEKITFKVQYFENSSI